MIRNLRFTFSGGRLVDYKADKNVEAFANYFKASSGEKDRIGSLTIGLNPRASYLGGFVDHFVAGAVTIGLGGNQDIGGANRSSFDFGATLQKASVTADGMRVVEAGERLERGAPHPFFSSRPGPGGPHKNKFIRGAPPPQPRKKPAASGGAPQSS